MALTWSVENVADYETVCTITLTKDDHAHGVKAGDAIWNPSRPRWCGSHSARESTRSPLTTPTSSSPA